MLWLAVLRRAASKRRRGASSSTPPLPPRAPASDGETRPEARSRPDLTGAAIQWCSRCARSNSPGSGTTPPAGSPARRGCLRRKPGRTRATRRRCARRRAGGRWRHLHVPDRRGCGRWRLLGLARGWARGVGWTSSSAQERADVTMLTEADLRRLALGMNDVVESVDMGGDPDCRVRVQSSRCFMATWSFGMVALTWISSVNSSTISGGIMLEPGAW